ncbi:MAG: lysylphosphatidylglycerol synthase transmembrane domain-containing protein [Candidatus Omnitrophota bacterium]
MRKTRTALIRIVISFGLLGLLFWFMRGEIYDIWETITHSNMMFISIGIVFFLVNVIMLAYRMKVIFSGETLTISLWESFQLTVVGYFFNNFLPTAVGGDIVKAHYAGNTSQKKIQSYASVFMDRIIGLYTFLVIAAAALIVDGGRFELPLIRIMAFVLLILGAAGFIVITNRRVARFVEGILGRIKMFDLGEKLNAIYKIVHDYRNRRVIVFRAFLLSIVAQCLYFFIIYVFFLSLGKEVSLGNIFLIMPIVTFISMMPSMGGLGVREGAIVSFFAPFAGKESAFAVSLLVLFGLFFVSIIGGITYFCWGFTRGYIKSSDK